MEKNTIYLGENLGILKTFPDNSVDSVVTDPPYGIGNREPTVGEIIAYLQGSSLDTGGDFAGADWEIPSVPLWKEVFRVLKPGGYVACWASTRTWDLMSLGLRAAGFEDRDTFAAQFGVSVLVHTFSSGFPKSVNISKQLEKKGASKEEIEKWEGFGTALKPSWEPILIFRKPLASPTLVDNVVQHGAGGMNIEASRVRHSSQADFDAHKASVDAVKSSGGKFRGSWKNSSDLSGANDVTYAGRWPPNMALVHEPGCEQIGVKQVQAPVINRFTDGMKPFGEGSGHPYETVGEGKVETLPIYQCTETCPVRMLDLHSKEFASLPEGETGASKYYPSFHPITHPFKYNPKANQSEATLDGKIPNPHPTKKPLALAAWVIKLVTPKGGLVLDPYAGSGSIPCAAVKEGFDTVGIDKWETMVLETARPRLQHYLEQREEKDEMADIYNFAFGEDSE